MGTLYVARSAKLSGWASEVGLSKHVFKVGYTDEPLREAVKSGWAGGDDWVIVRKLKADGLDEDAIVARLQRKEKMIDPAYYPRLKGATGIFKVVPEHVENHIIVAKSLEGGELPKITKLKPIDFADYLIHNATR
ncbi:MAG: hypothetical protein ACREFD_01950 [Stellaceae bacterium]